MSEAIKRPLDGEPLREALRKLASINGLAFSLREDLKPLSEEDLAIGAEPLDQEQIAEVLNLIQDLATSLAREEVQATAEEWLAANDAIQ